MKIVSLKELVALCVWAVMCFLITVTFYGLTKHDGLWTMYWDQTTESAEQFLTVMVTSYLRVSGLAYY